MHKIYLQPVLEHISLLKDIFNSIYFSYEYKEHNSQADNLSKKGLDVAEEILVLVEHREDGKHPQEPRSFQLILPVVLSLDSI